MLAVIPGTELVLLYDSRRCVLTCHDVRATVPPAGLSVDHFDLEAHHDERGKHLMMVITKSNRLINVICVEYGPGKDITMQKINLNPNVALPERDSMAILVQADMAGVFFLGEDLQYIFLAINIVTNAIAKIPIRLAHPIVSEFVPETFVPCLLLDQDNPGSIQSCHINDGILYFITHTPGQGYHVHHCNSDVPPFSNARGEADVCLVHDVNVSFNPMDMDEEPAQFELRYNASLLSAGLCISHTRYPDSWGEWVTTIFQFLPTVSRDDGVSQLRFASESSIKRKSIRGDVRSVGTAFSCMALLSVVTSDSDSETPHYYSESHMQLHLVQFSNNPDAITVHCLDVPSFIGLDEVTSILVDDYCGVVFLLCREFLFALPYA